MEEREMEILLEAMNRQFALVLEGLAALSARIDEFGQRLGAMIDHNSFKLEMLIEKLDAMDQRLGAKLDAIATGPPRVRIEG